MDDRVPQLVVPHEQSLTYNPFDVKWVPQSARLVVLGSNADGSGILQIFEMSGGALKTQSSSRFRESLKCGTFRASYNRELAVGDFSGRLLVVDLTRPEQPLYCVTAHDRILNAIDGVGGMGVGEGPAEIVTGGSDSAVKVWDTRTDSGPVVNILPEDGSHRPDCWAVAAGNAHSPDDRAVAAGFDNGDIKLFDLRTNKIMWETNIRNGVCSLEFDRRDILMNKLVATSLESKFHVFDVRTLDENKKFATTTMKAHTSTVWCAKHVPQNRDLWATTGGNGTINLWQYRYPLARTSKTDKGRLQGVPGTVEQLATFTATSQPITSFDWCADKLGLAAFTAIDQTLRVLIATRLNCL